MLWRLFTFFAILLPGGLILGAGSAQHHDGARATRVIADPGTHRCCAARRNREHPGWPPVLVAISDAECLSFASSRVTDWSVAARGVQQGAPIVHPGDLLVVVDDGRRWHSELRAVALSAGRAGDSIFVRLQVGSRVVRVLISASGRAVLKAQRGEGLQ